MTCGSQPELYTSSMDVFYESLRFGVKGIQSRQDIHRLREVGVLKQYLEGELIIVAHFGISAPPYQFCFVFHRVPYRVTNTNALNILGNNAGKAPPADLEVYGKADGVFFVSHGGERTNNVVTSDIRIRSRVWLMFGENIPKPLIDGPLFQHSIVRSLGDCAQGK